MAAGFGTTSSCAAARLSQRHKTGAAERKPVSGAELKILCLQSSMARRNRLMQSKVIAAGGSVKPATTPRGFRAKQLPAQAAARHTAQEFLYGDGARRLCHGFAGLFVLCLVAIATATPISAQEVSPQEEAVGEVVQQQGVVTALRATTARSLRLGASIFRGDRIITAARAKVEIAFADGSTLSLGPDTSVDVASYSPRAEQRGDLFLLIGIIRTRLSNLWSDGFKVRTRAAVASVRSTEWITEAREDRSSVFVISGRVGVTAMATDVSVDLSEGEGSDIEVGGSPSPPTQWGAARVEDVLARTRLP